MIKDGILASSILFLTLSGCSVGDQPQLGLVTGTVMLDNQPLPGIEVAFHPDNGRPARGRTDQHGGYVLVYIRDTPGCKVGHNRVEIGYSEEDEGVELEGDDVEQTPDKPGKKNIPARYNSETELEADVKPGDNVFDFDLRL